MNLVIVNENTIVVNALTIDIIKVLNGVYDVNSIEKELVNFKNLSLVLAKFPFF